MGSAAPSDSRCPRPTTEGRASPDWIKIHSAQTTNVTDQENRHAAYNARQYGQNSVVRRRAENAGIGHAGLDINNINIMVVILIIMFGLCVCANGKPVVKRASDSTITHTVDFLTKYGYLPRSSLQTSNLRTEDQLREAIRVMQRFGGVPDTGEIDAETAALMQRKRCGMPDLIGRADRVRRYALQGQKWQKNMLTYSISQETSRYANLGMVRLQMKRALDVWSDAANLSFVEVNRPDADIVISFRSKYHEDGYPFDGKGSVLAHAFFPGEGIGGDAHFDADEAWAPSGRDTQGDAVNLFSVAAHEFGHSLGLSHSTTQGSLMFPYYQHITDNFKLPYDDTVGIQQLYGPKTPIKWAPMPPVTQPPRTPQKTPQKPGKTPVRNGNPDQKPNGYPRDPVSDDNPSIPSTCNTNLDAINTIRREIFMFKDRYFWRRDDHGLKTPEPVEIERFWKNLPSELSRVDAIYERQTDNKIVFFTGNRYWLFEANDPQPGYPKPLTSLGLPRDLKKLDAAMIWGHNGKTYFFSGNQYWRFDEDVGKVEADYPRHMGLWKGVPENMDSAFQHTDGVTYFFKGGYFWKFEDKTMSVSKDSPLLISETWFSCPKQAAPPPMPPYEGAARVNGAAGSTVGQTSQTWRTLAFILSVLYVHRSWV